MTKKDYEAISLLIAELSVSPQKSAEILRGFMFYCEADNSRFDRDTFMAHIYHYTENFQMTLNFEGHSANA
jgi:hypothetical protein